MNDIEVLIALVAVAAVLVRFADVVRIPYPIVLVLGGLAIGFVPGGPDIELEPEVIFLVFLPPLLQSAGFYSSPQELRAEQGPLIWLILGLSLATMGAVAVTAYMVIPQMSWPEAFVVGAILAPTDPVAAIATFERIGVSDRVSLLVESESMINDATALVAYRVALTGVVAGTYSLSEAGLDLVIGMAGGLAVGLVVAWGASQAMRRLNDPPLVILISVLMAYVSFAAAEEIEASGVIAVVTAGLYLGWRSHEVFDADLRLNSIAFWEVLVFALNAIVFILLGLQFPDVLETVGERFSAGEIIGYGVMVSAVVILIRLAWQFIPPLLARAFPRAAALDTGNDWRERLLVGWCGMRGAVSMAAALALPFTLDSGETFGDRDLIIYLTVATILATLVLQGLTLPSLVRRLGLAEVRAWVPDEAIARLAAAQAALDRLDELEASSDVVPEAAVERLRETYRARFARCVAALQGETGSAPIEDPLNSYRRLRQELIGSERETLIRLRNEGRLKADVFRRIQRDLDLDEARIRS
jgi:CPA1 family monovalent cation:H+ antiporter